MAKPNSFLLLSLCFLVLFHCSVAQESLGSHHQQQQQEQRKRQECQISRLNAQEPQHRIEAEAGVTEIWDWNDDEFQCAGVAACRTIIQPRGLLLPAYANAPQLIYIVQGRGLTGVVSSGCPETYQSSGQQSREGGQGQRFRDQHQKIRRFRQGDVIALPAGVAKWCYNDGDEDVVVVTLEDTGNNQNQLDLNPRKFFLAGNPNKQGGGQQQQQQQREQQQREQYGRRPGQQQPPQREPYGTRRGQQFHNAGNVFSGFDTEVLAEAFGVDRETARKLQGQDDSRGHIVRVEHGLQVIRPSGSRQEEEEEEERERGRRYGNGLEETICSPRILENINDPHRADIFNPRAGRLTNLNSLNLPILRFLGLSAERGVLYRNALMAPHWKPNAHCILYATRGDARVQVVDQRGQAVFDGQVREGQLLVVPQDFVVAKQAGNEGFEYVAFKTNDRPMRSTLSGRVSAIRAIPVDVLANAYGISRDEAARLKFNREETLLMEPISSGKRPVLAMKV